MKNILEIYAPWIIGDPWDCIHEGEGMIDLVNRMPISERWRIAKHRRDTAGPMQSASGWD